MNNYPQAVPTGRHPGCGSGPIPTKPSTGQRLGTVINQVKCKEELIIFIIKG